MPGHVITCPYCFGTFDDGQVHFRMETVFTEDELDPKGQGRSLIDIEEDTNLSEAQRKEQIAEYTLRESFLAGEDPLYEAFWHDFGGTTEKSSISRDGKAPSVMPYHRPVYDPEDARFAHLFSSSHKRADGMNDSGMTVAAYDCFGRKTERRVCPFCHNPLPGTYGKYPFKFISVIGITGAGKTVYLSQLCKFMAKQISYFDIAAVPTNIYPQEYIEANPVIMGKKLPMGSPPEQLLQPLCFDLIYRSNNREVANTVVFFDIAGENCVDHEKMKGFGRFVENSDGIILIIDPEQFNEASGASQPTKVLDTIHTVFGNKQPGEVRNLPIAICISKGDKIAHEMIKKNLDDIQILQDNSGFYLPRFNAQDYNPIHDAIRSFIQRNDNELHTKTKNLYDNYNYFIFSAIGTSTDKLTADGEDYDTPAGPTIPKRILEPVLWLLYKYEFISPSGIIHEPKDWICNTCGQRHRVATKYCPTCKTNNNGEWRCPRCGAVNEGEWCATPKCKTNRFGKKKGLFG